MLEWPRSGTYILGNKEPNMKYLVVAAALAGAAVLGGSLATAAHAESTACKAKATEKRTQVNCKRKSAPNEGTREGSGISRADEERNDRAMTRNVLQSIEDQLRRQRIGN